MKQYILILGILVTATFSYSSNLFVAPDRVVAGDREMCFAVIRADIQQTDIYRIQEGKPELVHSFDWICYNLKLCHTAKGISVVKLDTFSKGKLANKTDSALTFYLNGDELANYTTRYIAEYPDVVFVRPATGQYTPFGQIRGYFLSNSNELFFEVSNTRDRVFLFSPMTGKEIKLGQVVQAR